MLLQLAKGREEEQRDPKSEEEDLIQHQDKRQDSTKQRYVKSYSNSSTESHNQNDIQTIQGQDVYISTETVKTDIIMMFRNHLLKAN